MYYYVYQITNLINGKFYVGKHKSARHPDKNGYYGSGKKIVAAIEKYGISNFKKEVLCYCSSNDEMAIKEAEIVTKDFVKRKDTYNMHTGGFGGWDHYLGTEAHKKSSGRGGKKSVKKLHQMLSEAKANNTEYYCNWYKNTVTSIKKRTCFDGWVNLSNDERKKRKKRLSEQSIGKKNSQYGTRWIYSLTEKKCKKILKNDPLPEGWLEGRKMKFYD